MIHYTTAALFGCLLLALYYTAMALIGGMYPPAPGEERTRYAYWYRVAQLLAANIQRAAEHRFGPDYAGGFKESTDRTAVSRSFVSVPTDNGASTTSIAVAEHTEVTAVAVSGTQS